MFLQQKKPRAGVAKFLSGDEELFVTESNVRGRLRGGLEEVVELGEE